VTDVKNRASFAGTRVVLRQTSPESEPVYDFIMALYATCGGNWNALAEKAGVSEEDLASFLEYAAMFLGNCGNYKSFGDSKFIPRCDESVFKALAATSPEADRSYKATEGAVFACDKQSKMHLGYTDQGHMTTYYPDSPAVSKDEIDAVSSWMEKRGLLPENTRLRKLDDGSFELLIASSVTQCPSSGGDIGSETSYVVEDGPLKGKTIMLVYGDHAMEMSAITEYMKKAADNADNATQRNMHEAYANSFESGSLLAFKDSQRFWIRDKGPMVECNIGFIETYRDPAGVRGEWEGFAAMVNCGYPFSWTGTRQQFGLTLNNLQWNVPEPLESLWRQPPI
jgi:dipeptidyl-peptidase III